MAKYTVISDIGNALVQLLRTHMVPDIIMNPDSIGLCSPGDKGDVTLGLYLYDITLCEEYRTSDMVNVDTRKQKYPPTHLTLYYMITAYSAGDVKFKAMEEHKMLGRVIQIFKDYAILDAQTLEPILRPSGMDIRITLLDLAIEEKQRIWNAPNTPYKLSLFYKVSPAEVESTRLKTVRRVVDLDINIQE